MADSNNQQDLEALLAEALGDFNEPLTTCDEPPATAQHGSLPDSPQPVCVQASSMQQAAASGQGHQAASGSRRAPAGLGLGAGLGSKLPARKPASSHSASQPAAGLQADAGSSRGTAGRQLPPHIQQLAAELMGLVDDAGIGAGTAGPKETQEDIAAGALDNDDASQAAVQALLKELQMGDSDDIGSPDARQLDDLLQAMGGHLGMPTEYDESQGEDSTAAHSDTVRQLLERTRETVQQQSKLSGAAQAAKARAARGAAAAAAAAGQGGGGGLPFGDLLGSLGGLANMAGGGEGAGANMVVDFIMQNLLSKDVLYAPLKEIRDKYPPWLSANAADLSPEDLARYTSQLSSIQAVCKQYESDPSNTARLMELIQEMQRHGDPPAAIVEAIGHSIDADIKQDSQAEEANTEEDFANMNLPPDFLKGLSGDLQKECAIQ